MSGNETKSNAETKQDIDDTINERVSKASSKCLKWFIPSSKNKKRTKTKDKQKIYMSTGKINMTQEDKSKKCVVNKRLKVILILISIAIVIGSAIATMHYFKVFIKNEIKEQPKVLNNNATNTIIYSKKNMLINTSSLIRGHDNKTQTLNTSLKYKYNEIRVNSTNKTSNTYLLQI